MTVNMKQPLTNSRDEEIILYDMNTMVEFDPTIASGYVALLSPLKPPKGKKNKKKSQQEQKQQQPDSPYMLAFLALTEGNVVDACFGIQAYHASSAATTTSDSNCCAVFSRRAKHLIAEAADTSEAVEKLAVDTYRQAFGIVMEMQQKIKKANILCRCFVSGRVRKRAVQSLRANFERLEEAIQAST